MSNYETPFQSQVECPVTRSEIFSALIAGEFKPFDRLDEQTYAGVECSGFTWTPYWQGASFERGEVVVVLYHGPGGMFFNVFYTTGNEPMHIWSLEATGDFEEIR